MVRDTDGSAFITKAEFDSLKNNFQAQIDNYNSSIDNKIDGAIASYLAGIKLSSKQSLAYLFDDTKPLKIGDVDTYFMFDNKMSITTYSFLKGNGNSSGARDSYYDVSDSNIGSQIDRIILGMGDFTNKRNTSSTGKVTLLGKTDGSTARVVGNCGVIINAYINGRWWDTGSGGMSFGCMVFCPGKNSTTFPFGERTDLNYIVLWNASDPTIGSSARAIGPADDNNIWNRDWINGSVTVAESNRNYYYANQPRISNGLTTTFASAFAIPTILTFNDNNWIDGYVADWAADGTVYITDESLKSCVCYYYNNQLNVTQDTFVNGYAYARVGGSLFNKNSIITLRTNELPWIPSRVTNTNATMYDKFNVKDLIVKYNNYNDCKYYSGFPFCEPNADGALSFEINMVDTTTDYVFMFAQEPFSQGYTESNTTASLINTKIGTATGKKLTARGATIKVDLEAVEKNKPVYIKFYKATSIGAGSIKNISNITLTLSN